MFLALVRKHRLAAELLTEQQLVDVIRQAIDCGDLMRYVLVDGSSQSVTYIPYRESLSLRDKYHQLIDAVTTKCEYETRHETALRYIRERESCVAQPLADQR